MKPRILTYACGFALLATPLLAGIDQESNTDGFDPAADSYRINEARRQNAIARQLELKYRMMWEFGFDPANPPVDQPIGHESKQIGPNTWTYEPIYPEQVEPLPAEGPELLPPSAVPVQRAPADIGPLAPTRKVPRALPKPADAAPQDFIPPQNAGSQKTGSQKIAPRKPAPQPPQRRGPREL